MEQQIAAEQQRFMVRVYGWMGAALVLTGLMAAYTASSQYLLEIVFSNRLTFYGLIILELVAVGVITRMINSMSAMTASLLFIAYALLNGLTFSVIFLVYTAESISSTFFVTAGTFGVMSIYGYMTKTDLTKLGSFLFMALVGLIIASVVNWFMNSPVLYWITTFAGVLIFTGLTAYDTQKVKNMLTIGNEGTEEYQKQSILGALTLYLDFINLFLYLLRIFGRRK